MTLNKMLIELNDKKFAIYVESDKRQLKSVCNEISRQTKQLVSFETHFFEIFDKDFGEYVSLLEEDQLIDDKSRIKVILKTQNSSQLVDNSDSKTISDIRSVDQLSRLRELSGTADNSSQLTDSWLESVVQSHQQIRRPITDHLSDTRSDRSFGHNSVKSFGQTSVRPERPQSSADGRTQTKSVSTTVSSNHLRKTSSVRPPLELNSFCDYLFDSKSTESVNKTESKTVFNEPIARQTPHSSTSSVSLPVRRQELERDQMSGTSGESMKPFMNFSKDKRVDTKGNVFTQSNANQMSHYFTEQNTGQTSSSSHTFPHSSEGSSAKKSSDSENDSLTKLSQWLFGSAPQKSAKNIESNYTNIETIGRRVESNSSSSDISFKSGVQSPKERLQNAMRSNSLQEHRLNQLLEENKVSDQLPNESISTNLRSFNDFSSETKSFAKNIGAGDETNPFGSQLSSPRNGDRLSLNNLGSDEDNNNSFLNTLEVNETNCNDFRDIQKEINVLINSDDGSVYESSDESPISYQTLNVLDSMAVNSLQTDTEIKQMNSIWFLPKDSSNSTSIQSKDNSKYKTDPNLDKICASEAPDPMEKPYECEERINSDNDMKDLRKRVNNIDYTSDPITGVDSFFDLGLKTVDQKDIKTNFAERVVNYNYDSDPTHNMSEDNRLLQFQDLFTLQHQKDDNSVDSQTNNSNGFTKESFSDVMIDINESIDDSVQEVVEEVVEDIANGSTEDNDSSPGNGSYDKQCEEKCESESNQTTPDPNDWESNPDLRRIRLNSFELFGDTEAIKLMLKLFDNNKTRFAKNLLSDLVDTPKWEIISQEMSKASEGLKDWTNIICKFRFKQTYRLYKECLTKCPDSETAVKVFPLFSVFHSVDLRYILVSEEYKRLEDLKESFDKKEVLRRRYSSVCSADSEPEYVEPIEDKIAIDSTKLKKITEMTEQKINFLKVIVECFDEVMKVEGQPSSAKDLKVFWDSVTSLVKSKGHRIYIDDQCRDFFRECVNDYYSVVLANCPNEVSAQKTYRLFDFIHSLDLKLYLTKTSFKKIRKLRKEFTERILKTSNSV